MLRLKKFILVSLIAISGLLLTLAGVGLIQLTQNLTLYSGVILLAIAGLMYLLG